MKTSDFDFELPEELIAQHPLLNRSASRLMVLNKKNRTISDKVFTDLVDHLHQGDVLVLNESRVLPARLFGIKEETNAHLECLILRIEQDEVECLVKKAKAVHLGTIIDFGEGILKFECIGLGESGIRRFRIITQGIFLELLEKLGTMPLPPYIKEKLDDQERYQTVYAKNPGSAAAPTAGLHFTPELLKQIEDKGIEIVKITLHVGLGTFRPVDAEDLTHHKMHEELYEVSEKAAQQLNLAKTNQRRIVAVGTTSVRTLETQMNRHGKFVAETSSTDIFITPGYTFKAVDALVTNFHLPKSTLVMLVSALSDREFILQAYEKAVQLNYRFFSFGDAMFIE
ncbi:MAG: tRNA preQ1(34) S-adenosylmethionine ribosyltransferase-isomerase QueA [Erysipelotrichaceae bacterium]|nr:tRNA preQ1(34) S-adenosylmethionine ribosyltransferase-isomerase QueA [Erysipelotrichaceae bacterium]